MESPFSSIFSREEEHRQMMKNSASDGLVNIVDIGSASLTAYRSSILLDTTQAPAIGSKYRLSDGLLAGKIVEWNGESFSSAGSSYSVISRNSATQVGILTSTNSASDTTSTVIEEITIPGFLLGKKSKLLFKPIWQIPNSATTKNVGITIYTVASGEQIIASNNATTSLHMNHQHEMRCLDSFTAQKTSNQVGPGNTGNPLLSTSANMLENFNIRFKASWTAAVAAETIYLLGYSIELLP